MSISTVISALVFAFVFLPLHQKLSVFIFAFAGVFFHHSLGMLPGEVPAPFTGMQVEGHSCIHQSARAVASFIEVRCGFQDNPQGSIIEFGHETY